nr:hypothetical protein [Lachnospiraceae bacterium]
IRKTDEPELELTVQVLNVNYGHNKELMEKCIPLRDYAILNERVRNNLGKGMSIEDAATEAVDSCIADHVMEDFLLRERTGVIMLHVLDFNEKLHNQSLKEEGYEEGLEKGYANGHEDGRSEVILSMLNIGRTPEEISDFCNIPIEQITKVQASQRV